MKKHRQKYNKFMVEGHKMVSELQRSNTGIIDLIVAKSDWIEGNQIPNVEYLKASDKQLGQISQLKNHSEVIALVSIQPKSILQEEHLSRGRYIYLYKLSDPGNCGTLLRIADWFGFDGVLLSPDSVDIYNSKVIQSSMGSIFRMPFRYISEEEILGIDTTKIGTTLDGEPLEDYEFRNNFILFFGNESKGLPQSIVEACDTNLLITDAYSKGAESLNIAVSAGIIMHHARL